MSNNVTAIKCRRWAIERTKLEVAVFGDRVVLDPSELQHFPWLCFLRIKSTSTRSHGRKECEMAVPRGQAVL